MTLENNDKKEDISPVPCEEKPETWWDFIKEVIRFTILSLVVVLPIRYFIAQPFLVSGSSMDPTFEDGQYLIIDELSYYFNDPQRGDVVVFRYPNNPSKYFIKRIIGLPGETIIVKDNDVLIKNKDNKEGFYLEQPFVKNLDIQQRDIERTLGSTEYFMMGDNRLASSDSRDWGPVDEKLVTGRVFVRLLPITKISLFPGSIDE